MHARKSITQRFMAPVLLVFVLILAACQPGGQSNQGQQVPVTGATPTVAAAMPTTAPTTAASPTTAATAGATGTVASSGSNTAQNAPSLVNLTVREDAKLGKFLADEKGMTLYIYTKDTPGKSVCEDKCLAAWPALHVAKDGKAQIDGKDDANLSAITRSDGSMQVAYKGMPLYYWVKDQKPGDVTGQGVGGVWYVVNPENGQSSSSSGSGDTGYGNSGSASGSSGATSAQAPEEVYLTVRTDAKLGKYLADEKGMTLYIFTKDKPGASVCEGDCLAKWPALTVAKGGKAEIDGKDDTNLSTITRSDGSTQVAYKGMPLYYWVKDQKPGDVTGQGVGGVWFVVNPENAQASSSSGGESSNASTPDEIYLTVRTDPKLGKFLADEKGMTLYIYTKDTPGKSVCEGQCLANWPALLVAKDGKAEVQGSDFDSKFGTTTRSDGSTQVTFNGMPLYYWVKDHQPGDVTGQGVGGVWYVVNPEQ